MLYVLCNARDMLVTMLHEMSVEIGFNQSMLCVHI